MPEEQQLVDELASIPHVPRSMGSGTWTFRRYGYTEDENPAHIGMVLQAEQNIDTSGVLGSFSCSAL